MPVMSEISLFLSLMPMDTLDTCVFQCDRDELQGQRSSTGAVHGVRPLHPHAGGSKLFREEVEGCRKGFDVTTLMSRVSLGVRKDGRGWHCRETQKDLEVTTLRCTLTHVPCCRDLFPGWLVHGLYPSLTHCEWPFCIRPIFDSGG